MQTLYNTILSTYMSSVKGVNPREHISKLMTPNKSFRKIIFKTGFAEIYICENRQCISTSNNSFVYNPIREIRFHPNIPFPASSGKMGIFATNVQKHTYVVSFEFENIFRIGLYSTNNNGNVYSLKYSVILK